MSIALQFLCKCSRSRYCSRLRPAIITIFQYQTCSYSNTKPESHKSKTYQLNSNDAQQRWNELRSFKGSLYPRIEASEDKISCQDFLASYKGLDLGETIESTSVTISGRIQSFRIAGSKLVFLDVTQDGFKVQGVCKLSEMSQRGITASELNSFYHMIRRGDIFSLQGKPHRTSRGQLSVLVSELPQLLSPCLHKIPTNLENKETRIRNRIVDFLVNRRPAEIIYLRSDIIKYVRRFLLRAGHIEVQTPILEDTAGGAVARPFQTTSVEFSQRQINLRIAPELWLKRMILGGFDKIFEIGSCFRNEGLDSNHNPEFTTCEFYRAYADLEKLIEMTEELISGLAEHTQEMISHEYQALEPHTITYHLPFRRLDFITEIELAIGCKLPDLRLPNVKHDLLEIFLACEIAVPDNPTVPRLLSKLSEIYLEPRCTAPTFIMNHPECLSPLAKSLDHPKCQQRVGARAELFIGGQEIANMYEEENSPFEQRRKFVEQLEYRMEGEAVTVDESYLQALEWGLPPTGGWGCGIDRLCMLMSGARRIGDVLPFGTLRNIVSLRSLASKPDLQEENRESP